MQGIERPLVSCICITFKRVNFLKNTISCFLQQTYPNKELIVGYTEDDHETHAYLTGVNDLSVIPLRFQSSMSLGEKRNLAVEFCSGVYFITWDDDDWHHQSRIEMQVQHLIGTGFKCSALSSIILFDGMTNQAYVSATRWGWEGTLLCEKAVIKELSFRYEPLNQGEDSPLLYQLKINNLLIGIPEPALYVYYYHGENTCHRKHWEVNFFPWGKKLSTQQGEIIKGILQGTILNPAASNMLNNLSL